MAGSASESPASPKAFYRPSRNGIEQLLRTFNCPLRSLLHHPTEPSVTHHFPRPSLQNVYKAISRSLSPDCSIEHAKWNNLVIIARSEGCHRCRFTTCFEEEASNFSAPMSVVQRYLLE